MLRTTVVFEKYSKKTCGNNILKLTTNKKGEKRGKGVSRGANYSL